MIEPALIFRFLHIYFNHSFEWRQTDQEVVVSLLVKNVTPDKVEVDVQKREVLILSIRP